MTQIKSYFLGILTWMCLVYEFDGQGGKTGRIVNCVHALRSFSDWKVAGRSGTWKYTGTSKAPSSSGKSLVRKNSEPFMNSISRTSSASEKSLDNEQCSDLGLDMSDMVSDYFSSLFDINS